MSPVLFLAISLTVLAAVAAIVAIGSETWNKEKHRPTKLGWIAVSLAVATALLGITKDLVSESEDAKNLRKAEAAQDRADEKATDLQTQLSSANGQLKTVQGDLTKANAALVDLGKTNAQLSARVRQVPAERHGFVRRDDPGRDRGNVVEFLPGNRRILAYDVVVNADGDKLQVAGGETIKFAIFFTRRDREIFEEDFVRVIAGTWQITHSPDEAFFSYPIPIRTSRQGNRIPFGSPEDTYPVVIETSLPRDVWEAAIVIVSPDSWAIQDARDATRQSQN